MGKSGEAELDEYNRVVYQCLDWFASRESPGPAPALLYHFTDAAGLIGILERRALWLSLATSLNDESEIEYGLRLAEETIRHSDWVSDALKVSLLKHLPEPGPRRRFLALRAIPFLASFCGRIDKSVHWLHYGHGGKGIAVGFEVEKIVKLPLRLARVEYKAPIQREVLRQLLTKAQLVTQSIARPDTPADVRDDITAVAFSGFMNLLSAEFKSECFAEEEEWRLVVYPPGHGPSMLSAEEKELFPPIAYRSVSDRVVPYLEMPLAPEAIKGIGEIVIGYSSPLGEDDAALRLLLNEAGISPKVVRSSVPVR